MYGRVIFFFQKESQFNYLYLSFFCPSYEAALAKVTRGYFRHGQNKYSFQTNLQLDKELAAANKDCKDVPIAFILLSPLFATIYVEKRDFFYSGNFDEKGLTN